MIDKEELSELELIELKKISDYFMSTFTIGIISSVFLKSFYAL